MTTRTRKAHRAEYEAAFLAQLTADRAKAIGLLDGVLQIASPGALVAAATGAVNLQHLAAFQLASRGLSLTTGEWVWFDDANAQFERVTGLSYRAFTQKVGESANS